MSTRRTTLIVILIVIALVATVWIVANPNQPTVAGSVATPVDGNKVADEPILTTPSITEQTPQTKQTIAPTPTVTASPTTSTLILNTSKPDTTTVVPPVNNATPSIIVPAATVQNASAGLDVQTGQAFLILNVSNEAQPGNYTFQVNVYNLNSVLLSFSGTMEAGVYYLDESNIQFPLAQSGTYQLRADSDCVPTDQVGQDVRESVTFNVSDGNFYMVNIGVTGGTGEVLQDSTIGFVPIWQDMPFEVTIDQGANWEGQMYQVFERCPIDGLIGPVGTLVAETNFTGPTAVVHLTLANLMGMQMPGMTLIVVTCANNTAAGPQSIAGSYKQVYIQANHPGTTSTTIDMTNGTYPMYTMHLPDPAVNALNHATVGVNIKGGNPAYWGNYTASYMINGTGTWTPINYGSLLLGHINLTLDLSWAPTTPDGTLNVTISFVFTLQGGDVLWPMYDYLTLSDGGHYNADFIR